MKKYISIAILLFAITLLSSCDNSDELTPNTTSTSTYLLPKAYMLSDEERAVISEMRTEYINATE